MIVLLAVKGKESQTSATIQVNKFIGSSPRNFEFFHDVLSILNQQTRSDGFKVIQFNAKVSPDKV